MNTAKDARARKEAQRARQAALGIKRVEVALSTREREQLETLRCARAGSGSGEPYSADEYISTLPAVLCCWPGDGADFPR